jgi:preprotein translocase subunit SecE
MEAVSKNAGVKGGMGGSDEPAKPPRPPPKAPPSYPSGGGRIPPSPAPTSGGAGYFSIYKKGQGYWTRMGTVAGVVLIGLLTANFLWDQKVNLGLQERGGYILVGAFSLVYAVLGFHLINRPSNVDFLIATDSEMKKVNWTSKKELIGSTRVVILFMFVVAVLLFVYDLFFHTIFYLIGVLKTPPFFFPQKH